MIVSAIVLFCLVVGLQDVTKTFKEGSAMLRLSFLALVASLFVLATPVRANDTVEETESSEAGSTLEEASVPFELFPPNEVELLPEEANLVILALQPALTAFVATPEGGSLMNDPGFGLVPLYGDKTSEADAFWGVLYLRSSLDPFSDGVDIYLQINNPEIGYPVTRLVFRSELAFIKDLSSTDTYQVRYSRVDQPTLP